MDNKYKSRKTPSYQTASLSRTRPVARIDTSLKFGPAIQKLTGVTQVSYYPNLPMNTTILLLGEYHNNTDGCSRCNQSHDGCWLVSDYIKHLASKTPGKLDVFLESPTLISGHLHQRITSTTGGSSTSPDHYPIEDILALREIFTDKSYQYLSKLYPSIRFHSWDLRQLKVGYRPRPPHDLESIFSVWVFNAEPTDPQFHNIARYFNQHLAKVSVKTLLRYFFDYYVTGYNLKIASKFVEKIIRATDYFQSPVTEIKRNRMRVDYTRYHLQKAVEAIDVTVASRFIDGSLFEVYFNIWYVELVDAIPHLASKVAAGTLTSQDIYTILVRVTFFAPDIYLFVSLFPKYTTINPGTVTCPRHLIVYGGEWHIRIITTLLTKLFSPPVLHASSTKEKSCIRLREPIQFF